MAAILSLGSAGTANVTGAGGDICASSSTAATPGHAARVSTRGGGTCTASALISQSSVGSTPCRRSKARNGPWLLRAFSRNPRTMSARAAARSLRCAKAFTSRRSVKWMMTGTLSSGLAVSMRCRSSGARTAAWATLLLSDKMPASALTMRRTRARCMRFIPRLKVQSDRTVNNRNIISRLIWPIYKKQY